MCFVLVRVVAYIRVVYIALYNSFVCVCMFVSCRLFIKELGKRSVRSGVIGGDWLDGFS